MTISTQLSQQTFSGNGATTVFTFSFVADSAANISVTYINSSGVATVLSPSQYTLYINPAANGQIWGVGGTLTYPLTGSPIATGTSLTIVRTLPLQQETTLSNQGNFNPQVVETALDTLCMEIQQINTSYGKAVQFPLSDPTTLNSTLPSAAARAGQYLAFDSNGNVITTPAAGTSTIISSAMIPVVQAATVQAAAAAMQVRTVLQGGANFYVNASTGNDSTGNGSSGSPWATLQYALNTIIDTYDYAGNSVNIYMTGAFTTGVVAYNPAVGAGFTNFIATGTCSVTSSTGHCFASYNGFYMQVGGTMTLSTTGAGGEDCLHCSEGGQLWLIGGANITFGACSVYHIGVINSGSIFSSNSASFIVTGNANCFVSAYGPCSVGLTGSSVTFVGTPTYVNPIIYSNLGSVLVAGGMTFSGAVNGQRFLCDNGGIINTGTGGNLTYFPGSTAGSYYNGTYDGDTGTIGNPGQKWTNMTSSRAFGSGYGNSTNVPIEIFVVATPTTASDEIQINIGSVLLGTARCTTSAYSKATLSFIVPVGSSYAVNVSSGSPALSTWYELR